MALKFDTTLRNNQLDTITSRVGASGRLKLYSGAAPASCAAALSGNTLLADLPLSAALAAAASGGVLTLNAVTQTNAVATGTAAFFRITDAAGTTVVVQGSAGATASGSDMEFNTTSIVTGGPVVVSSFTITAPGA